MSDLERIFYDFEKNIIQKIDSIFDETNKMWNNLLQVDSLFTKVNIQEKNNKVYVDLKIPGLTKHHQLNVNLDRDHLIIHGNLKKQNEVKSDHGGSYYENYSEYFYKNIPLPVRVTDRGAKAHYSDGALHISLYKIGELEDRNRSINVDFR